MVSQNITKSFTLLINNQKQTPLVSPCSQRPAPDILRRALSQPVRVLIIDREATRSRISVQLHLIGHYDKTMYMLRSCSADCATKCTLRGVLLCTCSEGMIMRKPEPASNTWTYFSMALFCSFQYKLV